MPVRPVGRVLALGIADVAAGALASGRPVTRLDWRPVAGGDPAAAWALAELTPDGGDPEGGGARVDRANRIAVGHMLAAEPTLIDILPAGTALPRLGRTVLHAGPPLLEAPPSAGLKAALREAVLAEGWADGPAEADRRMAEGEIAVDAAQHFGVVTPGDVIVGPSTPLFVVANRARGNLAYAPLLAGPAGQGDPSMRRLIAGGVAATLRTAIGSGINLKALIAQALHLGDDLGIRCDGANSLLFRAFAGPLMDGDRSKDDIVAALEAVRRQIGFVLPVVMAAAKAILGAAQGVAELSLVTGFGSNGTDAGLRVAGMPDHWYRAPAADLATVGDAPILEAAGLGAFALAAAPAAAGPLGLAARETAEATNAMAGITVARNPSFTLPALAFAGAPIGIDIRLVLERGEAPRFADAARRALGRAPFALFVPALVSLAEHVRAAG